MEQSLTWKDLNKYKYSQGTSKPNWKLIPVTTFNTDDEGAKSFNSIYKFILAERMLPIVSTPSGGISFKGTNFIGNRFRVTANKSYVELLVCSDKLWRFQFRIAHGENSSDDKKIYGAQAFAIFKKKCNEFGINLDDYKVSETQGYMYKSQISKPLIKLDEQTKTNYTYDNCYHIDFHNSYPAGLVNTHPEFKPIVEYFYNHRKTKPLYKAVLNYSVGYMQNNKKPYWAHLAKDAIEDNIKRVTELAKQLKDNHYIVLAYNTDGIWYYDYRRQGAYKGSGQGIKLGEWSNDHLNCKLRFKSAGCYEFIEDGKYTPIVRGQTTLDKVKPRSEWQWGDIFSKELLIVKYAFNKTLGIMRNDEVI